MGLKVKVIKTEFKNIAPLVVAKFPLVLLCKRGQFTSTPFFVDDPACRVQPVFEL